MADGSVRYKIIGDNTDFKKSVDETKNIAQDGADKITSAFKTAALAIGAAVSALVASGVNFNATMETYATSFEVMTGSAEKAIDITKELQHTAAVTPFEMKDLAETTQLLMNYGLTADEAMSKMRMLGDISQGSAEKLQRISMAYGQMSSAGKVMLEDVKQMIEAGFNPLQEISEATGESMASLYDRISKGAISVDEITASMTRATSAGGKYFMSMEKQSKTLAGQWSTTKDNFAQLSGEVADGLTEWLSDDGLPAVNDMIAWLTDNLESLIPVIGGVTVAVTALVAALNFAKAIEGVKTLFAVLSGNPIAIAVSALAGMITTLALYADQVDMASAEAREFADSVAESKEETDALVQSIEESNKAFAETEAHIEATSVLAEGWIGRLEELERKTSLSSKEQLEWNSLLSKLETTLPGVSSLIDKQTGTIKGGTAALKVHLEQWKRTSMINAWAKLAEESVMDLVTAEAELNKVQRQGFEAREKVLELQSQLNALMAEAQEQYGIAGTTALDYADALRTMSSEYGTQGAYMLQMADNMELLYTDLLLYQDTAKTAGEQTFVLSENIVGISENVDTYNAKMLEMQATTEGNVEAYANEAAAAEAAAARLGMSTEEYEDAINRRVDVTQNAFEKIESSIDLSAKDLTANLRHNQNLIEEWTVNLNELSNRTLSNGQKISADLIKMLEEAGPSAAATVANLVNATDDELIELSTVMETGSEDAVKVLMEELNLPEVQSSGADAMAVVADNLKNDASLQKAVKETVGDAYEVLVKEVDNLGFEKVGAQIISGIISGLNSKKSQLFSVARSIATTISSTINAALKIRSPSRVAEDSGRFVDEGLLVGIEKNADKPIKAARDMAEGVAAAVMPTVVSGADLMPQLAFATPAPAPDIMGTIRDFFDTVSFQASFYLDGTEFATTTARPMSIALEELRLEQSR